MSDTEDCSEMDRLYIDLDSLTSPGPASVPESEDRTYTDLSDLPDLANRDETDVQGSSQSTNKDERTAIHLRYDNYYGTHQWRDVTDWNMAIPQLQQHIRQAALFRPFSPISSPAPLFRPYSPMFPAPSNLSCSRLEPPSYQEHLNRCIDQSTSYTDVSDQDAEVSYYSCLSRDTDTPMSMDARRSATPSSASSCYSVTPTDMVNGNEQCSVTDVPIRSRKRKRSSDRPKRDSPSYVYRRHGKPPYTYCGMIVSIIQNSSEERLSLTEILEELSNSFEFFRGSYTGWRDSVRHNLSYKDCFVKNELATLTRRSIYKWSVNLSKVSTNAFCMQHNVEGKTGEYKKHIHEQLGHQPIELPGGVVPGVSCGCSQPPPVVSERRTKTKRGTQPKDTPRPCASNKTKLRLPGISDCGVTHDSPEVYRNRDAVSNSNLSMANSTGTEYKANQLRLPGISDCGVTHDSPEVYRNRDAVSNSSLSVAHNTGTEYEAITPIKSSDNSTIGSHAYRKSPESPAKSEVNIGYFGIARYILATEQDEGTSAALTNLSFLC